MTHLNIEDLKPELEKEAKELGLTLSAYIRLLLIHRPSIEIKQK